MEIESQPHASLSHPRKPGGWRAIKYILGNESFEKLASMSLGPNITVYLHTKYNLSGILLVNVVQIWNGTTNISSIAGAIVSDVYVGRFFTLLFGTIFSLLGMGAMTLTAGVHDLRPPSCPEQSICTQPHKWQLGFLFVGLGLIALGAGGIRPCNIAFGADQFDTNTEKGRAQLESFFNWWYFSFTIALVIALTGVVYIQTNVSWVIGYAIPTACLLVSITIFLIGRHTYIYKVPQGTVFVDMAKVVVAAFKKRKINLRSGQEHSFYDPVGNQVAESDTIKSSYSNKFRFFDKAAVILDPNELDAQGMPKNEWRLCSVQQVEKLKCLLGIVPVWISGVGFFLVMDQQSTFGILQAMQMNRSIGRHFTIPPGWMPISAMIALSIWIFIYEEVYIPIARKILKRESRLSMKQRITIGIVMSVLCMIVAGVMERKRKGVALREGSFISPLHVSALVPQFVLSGWVEASAAVAIMEFFTMQTPESMRSVGGSIFFLCISIASYFNSLVTNVIHAATGLRGKTPWIGGQDLNTTKLDYYYYLIAVFAGINLVYFTFFASKYIPDGQMMKLGGGEVELENARSDLPA